MLDLFGPTVHIGCSASGVAVLRRDRFGRAVGVPVERPLAEPNSVAELARQLPLALAGAQCRRGVASVTLSDDWLRLFVATPPSNCSHRRDCDAAVALRFQTLYGDDLAQWILRADWQIDRPFLVAALPLALQTTLVNIATQFKLRYSAVLPHSVAAWNRWHGALRRGDWFGVAHADVLTLIAIEDGAVRAVRRQPLDQAGMKTPDWLSQHVGREALRLNLAMPVRMQLCGEVPQPWTVPAPHRLPCIALQNKNAPAHSPDAALAFAGVTP
jgi:hypothetical protein